MNPVPIIAATNHKGGVGKTNSVRVLGQELASNAKLNKGKPVLIIDLDPQCNTSGRWKLVRPNHNGDLTPIPHPDLNGDSSSVCDVWLKLIDPAKSSYYPTPYVTEHENLHVVPGDEALMYAVTKLPEDRQRFVPQLLRKWLRSSEISEKYSFVLIDTPPAKGDLTNAALSAATHAYVPFIPEPQSVNGLFSILSYLNTQQGNREFGDNLILLGFLPNMVTSTKLHKEALSALRKHDTFSKFLMPMQLKRRIAYAETDNTLAEPGDVTSEATSNIAVEARRFARHVGEAALGNSQGARK
ncbi:ParA family protein [Marinobacter sp.]|uniref:ParA family protein n=1 Tax=Marinobacter sp. TaxID=50741 RepID=UPI003A8F1D81